ncbi:MAG TPA: hypothetical protein VKA32_04345 [Gammaproteobacteria bacterium]|nr:hypothetical protein [Gammaproteobacteria bacterium]
MPRLIVPCLLLAAALVGCTNVSETNRPDSNEPGVVPPGAGSRSGDQDKQEKPEQADNLLGELINSIGFGNDEKKAANKNAKAAQGTGDSTEVTRLRQEVRQLKAGAGAAGTAGRPGPGSRNLPGPAVGIVFSGVEDATTASALGALNAVVRSYPLTLVAPGVVEDQLSRYGCPTTSPMDCLPALAVQPGLRLLAVISGLQATGGDTAEARIQLFDADLGVAYDPFTLRLPAAGGSVPDKSLESMADALYINALDRLRIAPKIFHVVASSDGDFYLNRGRDAGLQTGMRLGIHSDARLVRGPSGTPAAWIPSRSQGTLVIERFTEGGAAVARLVKGKPPKPAYYLVPASS